MEKTSTKLIIRIKTLVRALRMDQEAYEAALASYGVNSSTELGNTRAMRLIAKLEEEAISAGLWQENKGKKLKYSEYDNREYPFASGKQLRMVDAMWKSVSRIRDEAERDKALDSFVKRVVGIDKFIWIEHNHIRKLVAAIKNMQKSHKQKGARNARKKITAG